MLLFRTVLLTVIASWAGFGQTYTISTFAGGVLPVNIPGTSASLGRGPQAVAVDRTANVFLVYQNTVLRLDATTGILTVTVNGKAAYVSYISPTQVNRLTHPTRCRGQYRSSLPITASLACR